MDSLVPGQAPSGYQTGQTSQLAEGNLLKGPQASSHMHRGRLPLPGRRACRQAEGFYGQGNFAATAWVLQVACSTEVSQPRHRRTWGASQLGHNRVWGGWGASQSVCCRRSASWQSHSQAAQAQQAGCTPGTACG